MLFIIYPLYLAYDQMLNQYIKNSTWFQVIWGVYRCLSIYSIRQHHACRCTGVTLITLVIPHVQAK